MSWLSSAFNAVKNVGSAIGGVVKKVATPLASFAVGLVPGVGPLLSQGVDILGNKLLGNDSDPSSDAGQQSQTPVSDYLATLQGTTVGLGSSPAAMALSAASTEKKGILGIGDGKPGIAGIGDGEPGIFGIGTGKKKAAKQAAADAAAAATEAAEYARKQAENAAVGEGLTPREVKLAGQQAAAAAHAAAADQQKDGSTSLIPWLIGGAMLLLGL
jgi:hypothetical protein